MVTVSKFLFFIVALFVSNTSYSFEVKALKYDIREVLVTDTPIKINNILIFEKVRNLNGKNFITRYITRCDKEVYGYISFADFRVNENGELGNTELDKMENFVKLELDSKSYHRYLAEFRKYKTKWCKTLPNSPVDIDVQYSTSIEGDYFFRLNSIRKTSTGYEVWESLYKSNNSANSNDTDNNSSASQKSYSNILKDKTLTQVNCQNHTIGSKASVSYNPDGSPKDSFNFADVKLVSVIPDTVGEALIKSVCGLVD